MRARLIAASCLLLALGCDRGTGSGSAAPSSPTPDPSAPSAPTPARGELEVAERIIDEIIALEARHPRLRTLSEAQHVSRTEDGRSVDLKFSRGVTYRPNPACSPGKKCSRLEDYARDGVSLNVYLSLDPWRGAAAVVPYEIGALQVVTFIDGPDTPAMDRLRADIQSILDRHRDRFAASQ